MRLGADFQRVNTHPAKLRLSRAWPAMPKVVTTRSKSPWRTVQPFDPTRITSRKTAKTTPQLRKLGSFAQSQLG